MKLFALTAVAFAAFAPAAMAMTDGGLTAAQAFEIRAMVPGADLSNLTDAQALALANVIHNGDSNEIGYAIRSILN